MGLLDFFGFGKKEKPSLDAAVARPQQGQLYFTGGTAREGGFNLRDFAANRIKGNDLGFGDDYLSKTSNPAIAQIDADFNNRTMPRLSSEASKRGLARSSIVQDQIGQADQSRNRDIESMMANFYQLNMAQKKTDQTQALNLATGLQNQEAGLLSDAAQASEQVRDLQVGRANTNNANSLTRQNQTIGALIGAATGGSTGGFSGMLTGAGTGFNSASAPGFGSGQNNAIKTQLLGQLDSSSAGQMTPQQFQQLLQKYYGF